MSRVVDETGHVYGDLTVIRRDGSKNGKAAWLCKCSCGKEVVITGDSLRQGYYVSCGCKATERMRKVGKANSIDITNKKFGRLTAIRPIGSAPYGGVLWQCQCECGNLHEAEYSNLVKGSVQSCGCLASVGEMKLQQWLSKNNIDFKTQYTPNKWRLSSGYKPYYDVALFADKTLICLIEFHGEQHRKYHSNKYTWNNQENFEKTIRRDKEKEKLCKNNNIPLYIIWYNDNLEEEILKICKKENLI